MGAAREITRRRGGGKIEPSEGQYRGELSSSSEEIIRYLRQQDDVVVPERNDTFLVNGRFHLRLDELAARANRMRRRQNKPLFRVHEVESQASQLIATETNNGAAPMFRTETRRLERVTA
jgi:hypothetical protein